ncbi:type 1 glutamine amidotransferase domain-containing protein [Streptomyces sp. 15-116A]|uniref:type 1 glutamine amidotransferase domain-containing protein n=1 Tax=Streptomyces sp. 15-116A TaxID=2259035 RepID=UPI0021B1D4C6|nr:type 1 glutamine amidotransferase domain-containing protein [Streptomyces sp. 15-116A]MCT7350831.1 type 1 glutamine amidotransferase domain-containing protein [Streptomyces sp. 15-116A]
MPKVLFALTSNDRLGNTGRKTGFYVPEVADPARVFQQAGWDIAFVSVEGGTPPKDGVKEGDTVSADFLAEYADALAATPTAQELRAQDYDAIYYAGGHGTMWDFPHAADLARLAEAIYQRGGVVAAVCHGPAGLLPLTLPDGRPLVDGKQVSAFTNEEEAAVGLSDVVPFALETALIDKGAKITKAGNFAEHAVADGRLVTGQNPASAARVAELTISQFSELSN